MNNSAIFETPEEHNQITGLREREAELVKTIEAIQGVRATPEWSSLKEIVFNGVVEKLERQILYAATRKDLDVKDLYQLQGQLMWAKRFADLDQLANTYRLELTSVRRQLNPPTERDMAPDTL